MASQKSLTKHDQVCLAAAECAEGDPNREFSAEDLLIKAWQRDPSSWGLRGYEEVHPNSEKMYTEIDRGRGKGGFVREGFLDKVRQRVYRLTPLGFARVAELQGSSDVNQEVRARRVVENSIVEILEHPIFTGWLTDPSTPKRFRNASHFWNIAPGSPPKVVQSRIRHVDNTLSGALMLLDARGVNEIAGKSRGRTLFERRDVQRCVEFHAAMKERFAKELTALGAANLDA